MRQRLPGGAGGEGLNGLGAMLCAVCILADSVCLWVLLRHGRPESRGCGADGVWSFTGLTVAALLFTASSIGVGAMALAVNLLA